ncbi:hypothetical protein [Rhodococcus spongiicola]|uniref:Uncharacterized protein n=1 Tax=Rhodococcus spongiicola TaxID=2487352 RepID=A0A438B613_9NOCA|nr:hypothetical protein [Rhodococcus spongiicola]RVW06396.1 hypothetical protein EF834_02925 [Rhodococcus spongiicola]
MADIGLLERYQDFRRRRFLRRAERYRHWLPRWRTQKRRRVLVVTNAAMLAGLAAVGVVSLTNILVLPLLWVPASLVFLAIWAVLQIVSGRQGDAPRDALDEWEIQQRDSARSIGLTVTQLLTFLPATFLLYAGGDLDIDRPNLAFSAGVLVMTALVVGACVPTMILAWTRPDPDPDDYQEPA